MEAVFVDLVSELCVAFTSIMYSIFKFVPLSYYFSCFSIIYPIFDQVFWAVVLNVVLCGKCGPSLSRMRESIFLIDSKAAFKRKAMRLHESLFTLSTLDRT